ncbi:MAG: RNA polymerase sigma factor [Bacteroidota bacterium]|nr:RNA polymerase sigma factor [Bacteroidota bacterium]
MKHSAELIQGCIEGNRRSQSELYEMFAPKMFSVCLRYSKNKEEAEEIVQEGFVQVFKSLKNYEYLGSLEGWIRKIMVFCAIQHYRRKSKMYSVISFETSKVEEIANEEILSRLGKKDLLIMIQELPPAYRIIFNLYVFEGMKHREIADYLGISEGTSKSNFFDAKVILQKKISNSMKIAKPKINYG